MDTLFAKKDFPNHLFTIPSLDFRDDLFKHRIGGPWFRLGLCTIDSQSDSEALQPVVRRESMLLEPSCFADIYDEIGWIPNVLDGLGEPSGYTVGSGEEKEYGYNPFHRFNRRTLSCEPLVFRRHTNSEVELFINPDLQLYLELEELTSGIWWDPKRGEEVLKCKISKSESLQVVEIQTDYLRKYLQARQQNLLVAHFRLLYLPDPSQEILDTFRGGRFEKGSPDEGKKVIVQNFGPIDQFRGEPYIGRFLHLWFEIQAPKINIDDPWAGEPPFDPYEFTLPTHKGPVAPARFIDREINRERDYAGVSCDFSQDIYFKQEVLSKYERDSRFQVRDGGEVICLDYWGVRKSISRIGNDLLKTWIGDFATEVPFAEWAHWKQFAVEPPSSETLRTINKEPKIPSEVQHLIQNLDMLSKALTNLAQAMNVMASTSYWRGSGESLAARSLKRVYPTTASDDEFLERATLMSTLVIDGLEPKALRRLCQAWGSDYHQGDNGRSLGSRLLLERISLSALLMEQLQANVAEIPKLVRQIGEQLACCRDSDLQIEIKNLYKKMRKDLAPLAFLYDLRIHGGLAHRPNKKKAVAAAKQLGLPADDWHRSHFLDLIRLVTTSVSQATDFLEAAASEFIGRQLSKRPLEHSTISKTPKRSNMEVHTKVLVWVLKRLKKAGLSFGKT